MRWIGYVATILWWSGIARSLSTVNRGHSYKITPKPCRVPGPEPKDGTCMFVWECIKSEGTHVGVCVDTFMFGSCCVHNTTSNAIAAPHHQQHASSSDPLRPTLAEALGNEATRPTLTSLSSFLVTDTSTTRPSHRPYETLDTFGGSGRPHKPLTAGSARPLQKRPHAKPASDHKDRIQTSAVPDSSGYWDKGPQSTRRPGTSEPWEMGAQSTKRPGAHESWEKGAQNTKRPSISDASEKGAQTTMRPGVESWEKDGQNTKRPGNSGAWEMDTESTKRPEEPDVWNKATQSTKRPGDMWEKNSQSTKRPSSPDHPEKNTQSTRRPGSHSTKRPGFQSTKRPGTTIYWENNVQNTRSPGHHDVQSPKQKTRPDDSQHTAGKEKDTAHDDFQGHHQGFKDKVDTGHNTLVIRLPGKEHASNEDEGIRPNRPSNQRPFESRPDEGKTEDSDLSGQESVHRPNINLVEENETAKEPHSNVNFIHTERPQWATKPVSPKPTTDFSKPYFSIKTTTYRPMSMNDQSDVKPNFISKPNSLYTSMTTSTTARPTYSGDQSTTSAAGSVPQTSHWQITTEPAFVTKQRPFSSTKPMGSLETAKPSSSHFWSENSWTPPRPSLKPHWTDNPSLLQNGPEGFPPRPSFKPTEPQENTEYHKPLGAAHYITTSHFETSARPRPTKKTTTSTTTTTTTTTTSTTTTTTTQKPDTVVSTTETIAKTGSVLTVSAADESKGTQCGVPPLFPRPETRIVGGKDAPFGRWPWQVSVRRTSFFGFSSTHRCGGAVLNENWIATAGHCVDDLLTSQIRIRVGEYDFSSVQERLPYVERGVAKKVVHPKYNFFTYEYDLALVKLESSLTFAPHISPICLPATDDLLIGENATVTGWGRLSEGGTLPSVLQEVSVPIVSNDRCKSMFLRAGRHEFIPDIFLCAGYETGGQDSCQGDSGGPLQVRGKDGRYFLAGIISWGIGCAEANLPGVCTRISKFVPWILKNVT
ncbi:serine proteinase stubble-like [Hylaeus volcanicus]|uniref:serine proteinase stubble-like n=1 Tax=Hylaeus volcanicus TaxID=313075 RepID=UPI0023B7AEC1|nr:serine proteinase stubble-like [Hylaeus volcanicus]XP_053977136.1 serine proteinase stubble-like [Hylaeus volcanicus]XP_053977137.1 serine proteinase stubble-like [Hylaeus volcanicus]